MGEELAQWQNLHFKSTVKGETSVRARADALRSLSFTASQLQAEREESLSHTVELYSSKYATIVDDTDTASGLNNYAEGALSRLTNAVNESQSWKSGLTVDGMMAMTQSQFARLTPQTTVSQSTTLTIQTSNHSSGPAHSKCATVHSRATNSAFPSTLTGSNGCPHDKTPEKVGHIPVFMSPRNSVLLQKNDSKERQSPHEQNRLSGNGSTAGIKESVGHQNCGDGIDSLSAFVTARQQLITNQRKRSRPGPSNLSVEEPSQSRNPSVSKRCLGTRRNPYSKFAPPLRKGGDDTSQWQRESAVTSTDLEGSGGLSVSSSVEDDKLKNLDQKMVDLIMHEIVDHGPPVTWEHVAGLEFAKTTIKEAVVWPMLRPDLFTGLRGPPKGILLFGPPGTGKTLIGKCIASQAGATFFSISASSLTSKWVGEGEKMVRTLFTVARCQQPAVIFIDEIDSLLTHRSDREHESSRRIKTEFLVQLDGATTRAEDLVLVVGATNRPQEIDEAARRRLSKRLYIPLPDGQSRLQIIKNLLSQQRAELRDGELQELCEKTEGYSGADVTCLCREAALGPIRSIDAGSIEHITVDQVRPITYQDFVSALRHVRCTVSANDLKAFEEWNRQFGSGAS